MEKLINRLMHKPTALTRWLHNPPGIVAIKSLPLGASLLDIGCVGFRQHYIARQNGREDLHHYGIDHPETPVVDLPKGFVFRQCDVDKEKIPFENDSFDMVVACHVIEHVRDPMRFLSECRRVCKPGGVISIESPSEISALLPGFPFQRDKFYSLSFYDDPTHVGRPWSAQGLFRLASLFGLESIRVSYDWKLLALLVSPIVLPLLWLTRQGRAFQYLAWKATGWNVRMLAEKPRANDAGDYAYYLPKTY